MTWSQRYGALRAVLVVLCAAFMGLGSGVAKAASSAHYALVGAIPGPDGPWDYMAMDPAAHRLYLAHNGAATVDLVSGKWEPTLDLGAMVSAVLPLRGLNRLIFSERSSRSVVVAELSTHRILGRVRTGVGTDGMTFDPLTGLAVVMAGESHGFAILVDVTRLKAIGRMRVGGDLEFPASNGRGTVYINVSSDGEIAVLDLAKRAIVERFAIKGCEESTGLAYEATSKLLISACDGMAAILKAEGDHLHLVKEFRTGTGADAVFVDGETQLAFVPCGGNGTLTVIDLSNPANPRVAQVVRTQKGARTGAVDPTTGTVYLQVAKLGAVPPGGYWPSAVPGTYRVLVFKPRG